MPILFYSSKNLLFLFTIAVLFTCHSLSAEERTATSESELNTWLATPTVDTINISSSALDLTAVLQSPSGAKTLRGGTDVQGAPATTLKAADGARILNVSSGDLTSISNIVFDRDTGGTAFLGAGGAVYVEGNITDGIHNSVFQNQATTRVGTSTIASGAAVYVKGNFYGGLTDSTFVDNTANAIGAMYVAGVFDGDISNVRVTGNKAENNGNTSAGGGIVVNSMVGNVVNSYFADNESKSNHGGGFTVAGSSQDLDGSIINSTFVRNKNLGFSSSSYGGGASVRGDITGSVTGNTFDANEVGTLGGGLHADGILQGVHDSVFTNNKAQRGAGLGISNTGLFGGIWNTRFEDNISSVQGGAIYAASKGINGGIHDSTFRGNSGQMGGAIVTMGIRDGIYNTLFESNTATTSGGGAIATAVPSTNANPDDGILSGGIYDSQFIKNTSAIAGSAIYVSYKLVGDIVRTVFDENESRQAGTLFVRNATEANIIDSKFTNNISGPGQGGAGAIFGDGYTGDILRSTFTNNVGGSMIGGALAIITGDLNGGITGSTFANNRLGESIQAGAPSRGGAIGVFTGGIADGITDTVFSANSIDGTLSQGGAIYVYSINGIDGSTFSGNTAAEGGALYLTRGIGGNVTTTTFTGNTASNNGGALYLLAGSADFVNPDFTNNTAAGKGGAIYTKGDLTMSATAGSTALFTGNTASGSANAVWFEEKGSLSMDVAAGAVMDMRDSIAGAAQNGNTISIAKTGSGELRLGGDNAFTSDGNASGTQMTISSGTLHLYGAGEVANANPGDAAAMVTDGVISLAGADSSFSLGDGSAKSTLVVGGDNAIHAGGSVELNDNLLIRTGGRERTSLALTTDAGPVSVGGTVEINVDRADQELSLAAKLASTSSGPGTIEKTGLGKLVLANDQAFAGLGNVVLCEGGIASTFDQTINSLSSAAGTEFTLTNADLTLSSGQLRGITSARNLVKNTTGNLSLYSKVYLDEALTINSVYIAMYEPTVIAADAVFAPGTTMNVLGYSGSGVGDTTEVVRTTNLIPDNALPTSYSVAGSHLPVDFISTEVARGADGKSIYANVDLTWNNAEFDGSRFTAAHGTFTLPRTEYYFELDAGLADRSGVFASGWDGKTLTKEGLGTLVLNGVNTYTGGTNVNNGMLVAAAEGALGAGGVTVGTDGKLKIEYSGLFENSLTGMGLVEACALDRRKAAIVRQQPLSR